jgi:hypothetical protein
MLRHRLLHRAAQRGRVDIAAGGLSIERRDVRDAASDDLVGHRAHALLGELEIYWSQSLT